ncbi:MAG: membrane dipeptidase [Ideonella sp. WA131b]|jgi:membrane dipeptidase|nr:membrane dipeptidase [Ideonella sp. WA131b]
MNPPHLPGRFDAATLLRSSIVWDNHGCMPVARPHDTSFLPQLERYRAAGVSAVMLNVGFGDMGIEEHVRTLASLRGWIKARPGEYLLLRTADDVERANATGRLAVGFDIEGANAVADQPSLVSLYYDLGVRWMLLAYNTNNRVGGGCQDEDKGLTPFGREVIAEMERVGMQVCCSHTGHRTVRDVFEVATRPVIFSHSNPSAVYPHPRNIPDDLIRACAATGGVVGINGIGSFLGKNDNSSETFARHVDHVAQLVGPQHVALGLDYVFDSQELDDYLSKMAHTFPAALGYEKGLRMVAPEQLEAIVLALQRLGYGDADLRAVLGGNLMRLARTVWKSGDPT